MIDPREPMAPSPMEATYNRNSRVQADGLSPAVQLFERTAIEVELAPSPEPIIIADYGSSAGHNSLVPMRRAIGALRERVGSERPISVVHTDLPTNDFAALFEVLATDPESYQAGDASAFASAVGRSFYQQILPSSSVTLGWSSWAVQWLSQAPGPIPDHVQVACSRDVSTRQAFALRAASDWRTFLACRARELRPGGRLVVLTMAVDESGDFGYGPLLEALYLALTTLVDEKLVSGGELRRMVIPTVGRSRADLLAPFEESGSFAGLSVEHLAVFSGEDRIWKEFEDQGDAHAFGAKWAAFSRASVFPTLANSLSVTGDDRRPIRFFDQLEAGLAARLASAPAKMLIPLAKLSLVMS